MLQLGRRWERFWFEPAAAGDLALCRIAFYGAVFVLYLGQDFSAWGSVAPVFWRPISFFEWLDLPLLGGDTLWYLQIAWKAALGLACLGLFTRFSTVLAFVLGLYLLGLPNNFLKVHHFDGVVVLVLGVLAFARVGDSWSLDRWLRRARGAPGAAELMSGQYRWPVRLVWVILALVFFAAGTSKLRHSGLTWIFSDHLAYLLVAHQYHLANADPLTSWGLAIAQHGWATRLLAAATVFFELGYPLALVSRRAAWVFVPGMLMVLIGIRLLMGPSFEAFVICHIFWIPWAWLRAWALRAGQGPGGRNRRCQVEEAEPLSLGTELARSTVSRTPASSVQ